MSRRLFIAGTRDLDRGLVCDILPGLVISATEGNLSSVEIGTGDAHGVARAVCELATAGLVWAPEQVRVFGTRRHRQEWMKGLAYEQISDWNTQGKAAGPIRNQAGVTWAEAVLVIWTGNPRTSPGSADVLRKAGQAGKRVFEVVLRGEW